MARKTLIQVRRDTAANWTSTDPTLAAGELGLETDTGRVKAGDGSTAWSSLNPINSGTYATADDPLSFGIPHTHHPLNAFEAGTVGANVAYYLRVKGGGTISSIGLETVTASGNIMVAAYTNSGSGRNARPTGGQLSVSASTAASAGYQEVALGSSVELNSGDWLALSCDNATATFRCVKNGSVVPTALVHGFQYQQSSAFPLPATPSSLALSHARGFVLLGVA